jgi:phosphatidylserine decarboxylase
MALRQIAGAVARRIVCPLRPGDVLARGEKIGMIKLGSRTELILPDGPELRVEANVGDRVRAGVSVVARRKEIQNSKSEIRDKSQ